VSVIIQGSRKVRALRPNMSLPICRRTITMTSPLRDDEWKPKPTGVGLLEDFCSANLPRIVTKERGSVAHDFIAFSGVGNTNEIDVFLATKLRTALDDKEPELGVTSMIRTPCEEYVADLLVPAGVLNPKSAIIRVLGCMEDVSAAETASDEYRLAPPQPAAYLGTNIEALHDDVFARCPEMIRFVLRDLGRSRMTYDVFRARVRYPMLHTCIALDVMR